MSGLPVTEAELHAYVDDLLPHSRRTDVEAYLSMHADDAQRVAAWREQNRALQAHFDSVLTEPVPARLRATRRALSLMQYAAIAAVFVLGIASGWFMHQYKTDKSADTIAFAQRAAVAHIVYSPEVRHPVEVGADQEAHLVAWLSKRLGGNLKIPTLGGFGYQLMGGASPSRQSGPRRAVHVSGWQRSTADAVRSQRRSGFQGDGVSLYAGARSQRFLLGRWAFRLRVVRRDAEGGLTARRQCGLSAIESVAPRPSPGAIQRAKFSGEHRVLR